ncbi:MAG: hypothetical protein CNLJKLNK_01269 [Holosporales bacterium]
MFKNVTEVDESGKSIKTLREVKKIMDPLKVAFDNYFTRDRLSHFIKAFKPRLKQYMEEFDKKIVEELDRIREEYKSEKEYEECAKSAKFTHVGLKQETRKYIILEKMMLTCTSIDVIDKCPNIRSKRYYATPLSYFINLKLTEEEFNTYFPIELQKIFFLNSISAALVDIFKTCDMIFDRRDLEDPIKTDGLDINSKLDAPFVFFPHENHDPRETPFNPDFLKKLHENIAFMLDHHVRFFDIQAEDNVSK